MIETIRKLITAGIDKYTDMLVVDTDNPNRKPQYPYFSFKIITLKKNSREAGNVTHYFDKSLDERFKYDYVKKISLQPEMIISFNSYSNDIIECQDKALKAWEWFKFVGYQDLMLNNFIIVDVGNIQDRTVQLGDNYEFRQGFDVTIRYLHSIERRLETIENYDMKGEII